MMNAPAKQQNIRQIPPADLTLGKDEVHVRLVRLDQEDAADFYEILSEDECAKANRFSFEKDRNNFIIGRGFLRTIIGQYLAIKPQKIYFEYNHFGKPFLPSNLKFNLSHSGNLALYAFCLNREIGVDIEQKDESFLDEGMVFYCLTAQEKTKFYSLSKNERISFFFDCWTKKEAYLKAVGFGLSLSPNELEISNLNQSSFSCQNIPAINGYSAALSVEGSSPHIKYCQVG